MEGHQDILRLIYHMDLSPPSNRQDFVANINTLESFFRKISSSTAFPHQRTLQIMDCIRAYYREADKIHTQSSRLNNVIRTYPLYIETLSKFKVAMACYFQIKTIIEKSLFGSTMFNEKRFSKFQKHMLHQKLLTTSYPSVEDVAFLIKTTNLSEKQILQWFSNARRRSKCKRKSKVAEGVMTEENSDFLQDNFLEDELFQCFTTINPASLTLWDGKQYWPETRKKVAFDEYFAW